jgi:uncharacterized protein YqeY
MNLFEQVQTDLVAAMKAKDKLRLSALRMFKTALLNKKVEKGADAEVSDEEAMAVVKSLVKQRREAAEEYRKGDREDAAQQEDDEAAVLEAYLPAAVSEDAIKAAIDEVVTQTGAATPKDMGKVMGPVMAKFQGQNVDGKLVNQLVKQRLGG